jgi:small conductance mechanosensitive channel
MNIEGIQQVAITTLTTITNVGLQVLGAIIFVIVGRWLIRVVLRMISGAFARQEVDQTVLRYLISAISVALNVLLVIAILGYFGVETTSFAALIAAMGIAIGAAWAGLLANFAAGAFIVLLRPFKVGDFITVAGVTGTVVEIGLFSTVMNTPDNVRTVVGNNKIFTDNIQNFTNNPFRRVDRSAQIAHGVDPQDAIRRLKEGLAGIPNVLTDPAPDVEILDFNANGTLLAVRPYCSNDHYWQVYFDTNNLIAREFSAAGYPVPEQRIATRQLA